MEGASVLIALVIGNVLCCQGRSVSLAPYDCINDYGSESGSGSGEGIVQPCSLISTHSVFYPESTSQEATASTMSLNSILASSLRISSLPALPSSTGSPQITTTTTSTPPALTIFPTPMFSLVFTTDNIKTSEEIASTAVSTPSGLISSDLLPVSLAPPTFSPIPSSRVSYTPSVHVTVAERTIVRLLPTQSEQTVTVSLTASINLSQTSAATDTLSPSTSVNTGSLLPTSSALPNTLMKTGSQFPTSSAPTSTLVNTGSQLPTSSALPSTLMKTGSPLQTSSAPTSTSVNTGSLFPTSSALPSTLMKTGSPLQTSSAPTSTLVNTGSQLPTSSAPTSTSVNTGSLLPTSSALPSTLMKTGSPLQTSSAPTSTSVNTGSPLQTSSALPNTLMKTGSQFPTSSAPTSTLVNTGSLLSITSTSVLYAPETTDYLPSSSTSYALPSITDSLLAPSISVLHHTMSNSGSPVLISSTSSTPSSKLQQSTSAITQSVYETTPLTRKTTPPSTIHFESTPIAYETTLAVLPSSLFPTLTVTSSTPHRSTLLSPYIATPSPGAGVSAQTTASSTTMQSSDETIGMTSLSFVHVTLTSVAAASVSSTYILSTETLQPATTTGHRPLSLGSHTVSTLSPSNTHTASTAEVLVEFTTQLATFSIETPTTEVQPTTTVSQMPSRDVEIVTTIPPYSQMESTAGILASRLTTKGSPGFVVTPTPSDVSSVPGDSFSDESISASLYTAVGGGIGACIIIAVVLLVVVGAVVHKRRRSHRIYYTIGMSRKKSSTDSMGPGLFNLSLSHIDCGPLTSQLSRASLGSMTPTSESVVDKTIFDNTLELAYKTSTFTRATKHSDGSRAVGVTNFNRTMSLLTLGSTSSEEDVETPHSNNKAQPTPVRPPTTVNPTRELSVSSVSDEPLGKPPTTGEQRAVEETERTPECSESNKDSSASAENNPHTQEDVPITTNKATSETVPVNPENKASSTDDEKQMSVAVEISQETNICSNAVSPTVSEPAMNNDASCTDSKKEKKPPPVDPTAAGPPSTESSTSGPPTTQPATAAESPVTESPATLTTEAHATDLPTAELPTAEPPTAAEPHKAYLSAEEPPPGVDPESSTVGPPKADPASPKAPPKVDLVPPKAEPPKADPAGSSKASPKLDPEPPKEDPLKADPTPDPESPKLDPGSPKLDLVPPKADPAPSKADPEPPRADPGSPKLDPGSPTADPPAGESQGAESHSDESSQQHDTVPKSTSHSSTSA